MHDTTGHADLPFSRRLFLERGLVLASLSATAPSFIARTAHAIMPGPLQSSTPGVPEDRVLVVVQLGGGNDGLNTVVPYAAPEYFRARPSLAVRAPGTNGGALELDPKVGVGLHPSLGGLKTLHDAGALAIVQGVGYPNPNRSHFTSMDIWHTADVRAKGVGWLGRYYDHACAGSPLVESGVALGREAPLAMVGAQTTPITFESARLFRWAGSDLHERLVEPYREIQAETVAQDGDAPGADPQLAFLQRTALEAQASSAQIRNAVAQRPLVQWPGGPLADQLRLVAAMLRSGLRTRVYYASLGGFDTHAGQAGPHGNLLGQVGNALEAFHRELVAQGDQARVLTMVFSEFGRRVAQNASGGTDHGTAAPMFLMGDMVRPGVLGQHPSFAQLDQGDLIHTVDFRHVYAAVLGNWMGADADAILGQRWQPAEVLRA